MVIFRPQFWETQMLTSPLVIHPLSLDFSYMTVTTDLNFIVNTAENLQTWLISPLSFHFCFGYKAWAEEL